MKKYLKKYLELSRFKQIVIAVFAFHILFTFACLVEHLISSRVKKPKALVVRIFKINPPKPKPTQIVSRPAKKEKPKQVVATPRPKQVVPKRKPTPKKVAVKAKNPLVTKHSNPKTHQGDALLKEIAESFDVFKSEEKKMKHMELDLPSKAVSYTHLTLPTNREV